MLGNVDWGLLEFGQKLGSEALVEGLKGFGLEDIDLEVELTIVADSAAELVVEEY